MNIFCLETYVYLPQYGNTILSRYLDRQTFSFRIIVKKKNNNSQVSFLKSFEEVQTESMSHNTKARIDTCLDISSLLSAFLLDDYRKQTEYTKLSENLF